MVCSQTMKKKDAKFKPFQFVCKQSAIELVCVQTLHPKRRPHAGIE